MTPPASRNSIIRLLSLTANQGCRGCGRTHAALDPHHHHPPHHAPHVQYHSPLSQMGVRGMATPVETSLRAGLPPGEGDYAFEVRSTLSPRMKLA
jgi:hydroxyacid-oxoacid transhydrogenase